jgi:hypothetical protein
LAELCATNSGARCLDSRVNISAIEEGGSATGRLLRSDGAGGVSGEKPMARMQAIRERLRLDRCSPGASCQRARRLGGTPLSAPCLSRVFLDCSSIVPRLFLDCSSIVPRLFLDCSSTGGGFIEGSRPTRRGVSAAPSLRGGSAGFIGLHWEAQVPSGLSPTVARATHRLEEMATLMGIEPMPPP